MSFIPVARFTFEKVTDISPDFLKENGITFLILDLDNTVSPYGVLEPTEEVYSWVKSMKNGGIDLFIVSNSHKERPRIFSEKLDIPYIMKAKKPSRRGVIKAMKMAGKAERETALVGDQSYTDVLCANRSKVTSILVQPISLKNPLLAVRYFFELPFRAAAKKRF